MVSTTQLATTKPIVEIKDRLDALETYGIYTSLSDLKKAKAGNFPYTLITISGKIEYSYVIGDFSNQIDDINLISLDSVLPTTGALLKQSAGAITTKRSDSSAVPLGLDIVLDNLSKRPEEFGAVGDGIHDDTDAIQKAFDAITAISNLSTNGERPGYVVLTQGKQYLCSRTITMDRKLHNLVGSARIKWTHNGVCLRVYGTNTSYGNANGYSGCIDGQIVIDGSNGTNSVGIFFDTDVTGSNAGLRVIGVTVANCGTSFRIGSRGYNAEFINCKSFGFNVCFDWTAEGEDSNERITVFGGTFFNGEMFLRHHRPAGAFYVFSSSIDYTSGIVDAAGGMTQFFGVHVESSRFNDTPFKIYGDRASFVMKGGWLMMQPTNNYVHYLFNISTNCTTILDSVLTHACQQIIRENAYTPVTWSTGGGRFVMKNTQAAYQYGGFPRRLMRNDSALGNWNFEDNDLQTSPIWRTGDVLPIRSRDGSDVPQGSESFPNIKLLRNTTPGDPLNGSACLELYKAYGPGSTANCVILCKPACYGDMVTAGVTARLKPSRPGDNGQVIFRAGWASIEGYDQYGVPIIRKFVSPGDAMVTLTTNWMSIELGNEAENFVCPGWANTFIIQADQFLHNGSVLIDQRWADVM